MMCLYMYKINIYKSDYFSLIFSLIQSDFCELESKVSTLGTAVEGHLPSNELETNVHKTNASAIERMDNNLNRLFTNLQNTIERYCFYVFHNNNFIWVTSKHDLCIITY